jgi:hypothetical protein
MHAQATMPPTLHAAVAARRALRSLLRPPWGTPAVAGLTERPLGTAGGAGAASTLTPSAADDGARPCLAMPD